MTLIPQVSLFDFIHTCRIKYWKILEKTQLWSQVSISGLWHFPEATEIQKPGPLSLLLTQQHKPGKFTWTTHMRRVFMNSSFIAQPAKGELYTSAGNKYRWKPVGLSFSNSFLKWYRLCVLHPLDLQWWTKAAFSVWVFDLNNAIFFSFFGI